MSRGAGKVQTAILSLIASDDDGAWTTTDVCEAVYRGANRIEKKHRVSVSRAIRTMDLPEPWAVARLERSGCEYMIFNRLSLESTLRKRWQSHYALSGISFEYFKVRYSHQIPKAEEEVAEYRNYFEADELGRINIEIRDAQTSLGMLRAVGVGAEFIQSIADRITRLLERKAEAEAKLSVSSSAQVESGNTYQEDAA
ncbi:hypothetical protein FY133_00485 [Agrobacterium tumefaciens]|uniref:hypothetical protein n=1 Tax=Agrobacterium tumefaciens TaxID=358 RepID=UPI0021D0555C|nr:hypothetical protein [Agrobacterium tumefaciens]UXT64130.1 hypothetical protein FY133_00485 [Agrobacterium tumefaciens]